MKDRILEGALKLFLKEGFDKVTVRKIAEEIEYSPATLYLYYKDKGEILYALHEEGFERLYRKQRTILSIEDPLERLGEHARIYISFALEMPEFYDLMFIMKAPAREIRKREEWSAGKRSYDFLRQNVQACIDARYFKGIDVETLTFFKWAMVHGIASLVIRQRTGMIPEEYLRPMIEDGLRFFINNERKR